MQSSKPAANRAVFQNTGGITDGFDIFRLMSRLSQTP
jgi:hypothetical protein